MPGKFDAAIIDNMEPQRVKFPLGSLSSIEPESVGEPGHRTFRLILGAGSFQGSLWLEKEQLFQLAIRLQDTIEHLSAKDRERATQPKEPGVSAGEAGVDFKAGQLSMGYEPEANAFFMMAQEEEAAGEDAEGTPEGEEPASVSFWITTDQAEAFAGEALRVCAAGRPRCFLCGLPIDPEGHVCPRSNGHTPLEGG